jgi:two-component system, cell cycle response regulator DivK
VKCNDAAILGTIAMRIVIVEDDSMNALVMSKILTRIGGHQVTVLEAVEAVQSLIQLGEVDVVVMDVSLSNTLHEGRAIDGVEFVRLLRADHRHAGVPILLATAHAMKGDAERLIAESGADGYVAKPISDPHAFVAKVEACARAVGNGSGAK